MKRYIGLTSLLVMVGCGSSSSIAPDGLPEIHLESSAFQDGQPIPAAYTCDGPNQSPPLAWRGVPNQAKSLVLICEDSDAPLGTWSHWVLWNLPPHLKELPAGLPKGSRISLTPDGPEARQGINDFGDPGYGGPCPPSGTHHYVFQLYALDEPPDLPESPKRARVLQAIREHVVATGRLVGLYSR